MQNVKKNAENGLKAGKSDSESMLPCMLHLLHEARLVKRKEKSEFLTVILYVFISGFGIMLFFAFAENLKPENFIGFLKAWRQGNTTSEAVKLFFLFFSGHGIAKTYDNCRNEGRSWISSLTWQERNSNLANLNLHDSFNLPVILDIVRRPDKSRTKATKGRTKNLKYNEMKLQKLGIDGTSRSQSGRIQAINSCIC